MPARTLARGFVALLVGTVALAATAQSQTTWYVDDDALNDPGPGDPTVSDPLEDGSADHPFDAIQEGIDAAADGDTVLVLDGTYTGDGNRDLNFGGKAITIRSENGPESCVIDCEGSYDDQHLGFYFDGNEGPDSVVEGLTVTNGYVGYGGGVFCRYSSPTFTNCTLSRNFGGTCGGGIYCWGSNPTLTDCTISGNGADFGGGVRCRLSSPTLTNCTIRDNVADCGGGIECKGSSPTLARCTIVGNRAYLGVGGGIYCWSNSSPTLTDCTISENWNSSSGGGLYCDGSSPTLTNCTISENSTNGGGGGGTFCSGGNAVLINCTISGNSTASDYDGGAGILCSDASAPSLTNCTISGNSANGRGGAVLCEGGSPTFTNCTLVGNTASLGTALACDNPYQIPGTVMMSNCIVWNGIDQAWNNDGSSLVFAYCDFQGGWTGEGNIDADPLFVDPGTVDYRLATGSPCIDAGDNEAVPADALDLDGDGDTDEPIPFDLDGNPRFVDDPATDDTGNGTPPIVDMGAYEFQPGIAAHLDIKPGSCPNSLNLNGHGVLSAAIVGTAEFDVTQIDVNTLLLTRADGVGGGVTPLMGPPGPGIHVDDVATPFDGELCECHEYEGDGIDDLTIKFANELVIPELQLAEFAGGSVVELVVSGQLLDGTPFAGTDCVTIRPTRSKTSSESMNSEDGERETLVMPSMACGALSPVFLPAAIVGISLVRRRRRGG